MSENISENPVRPTNLIIGPEGRPQEVSRQTAEAMKKGDKRARRLRDLEREQFFKEHPELRGQRLVDARKALKKQK